MAWMFDWVCADCAEVLGPEIVSAFPACVKVMLLPPANVRVPDETSAPAPEVLPDIVRLLPPTEIEPVIVWPFKPHEMPFESANESVPEVAVAVPAIAPERPV